MCRKRSLTTISLAFALVKIACCWLIVITAAATAAAAVHLHASHETTGRHLLRDDGGWGKGTVRFDFSGEAGGGKGFLRRMQRRNPNKVNRIMSTSGKSKTIDEIGWLLENDRDLGIDEVNDALVYVCPGIQAKSPAAASSTGAPQRNSTATAANTVTAATPPGEFLNGTNGESGPADLDPSIDNVWILSSRPTAVNKIWLDFRGGEVSGTAWGDGIVSWPAYDSEGDPNAFTDEELGEIVAIWRAVAEDFAPFNVDVTTIDQIIAETANSNYMRIAIGGSAQEVLNATGGGIAFVGAFGREDLQLQPAFVFPQNLCGPKCVWEATSHEVGHTMGLFHDGQIFPNGTGYGYYLGTNGWAPIMGAGVSSSHDDQQPWMAAAGYMH